MKKELSKSEELKLMIIENFILWYTSDEEERIQMGNCAFDYVSEDHVNELEEYL